MWVREWGAGVVRQSELISEWWQLCDWCNGGRECVSAVHDGKCSPRVMCSLSEWEPDSWQWSYVCVHRWTKECLARTTCNCVSHFWMNRKTSFSYLYEIITNLTLVGTDFDRLDLLANYWCFSQEGTAAQDTINFILQNRCVFHDKVLEIFPYLWSGLWNVN